MRGKFHRSTLVSESAVHQSVIAIVLISVVPLLSMVYIGVVCWLHPELSPVRIGILIFSSIVVMDVAGVLILFKYPRNIVRLRKYISNVAEGVFPVEIRLFEINKSDDLMYIENGLNAIIEAMRKQVEIAEGKLRVEQKLRETIERQQQTLVHAERHRAMIQSLGAACYHLNRPVSILSMRLKWVKKIGNVPYQERIQIEECEKEIGMIVDMLDRLKAVSEFRTEPYVADDYNDTEILAV